MKLLIATGLYPPDIGGPATYSKILAEELSRHGTEVEVLGFGSVRKLPKVIRHIVYFFKVLKLGRTADVIFAQDPISVGLPSMLAVKILRKKFILKIVGDYAWEQWQVFNFHPPVGGSIFNFIAPENFLKQKVNLKIRILKWVERLVARKADKVIVPSKYLKKIVIGWGVKLEKIEVIYNAVEFKAVDPIKHDGEKWVVSVGRLVPWKGFDTLIGIMTPLCHSRESGNPAIKLKIIGGGPQMKNYKLQIINYKLDESVELIGELSHDKTLAYIKSADVFILNSGYEGLSHVILEALSFNRPVLASRVGGNPELLSERSLFTYNDKKEILEKIKKILENGNDYVMDKKVLEKFRLDKMIEDTKKILCGN